MIAPPERLGDPADRAADGAFGGIPSTPVARRYGGANATEQQRRQRLREMMERNPQRDLRSHEAAMLWQMLLEAEAELAQIRKL